MMIAMNAGPGAGEDGGRDLTQGARALAADDDALVTLYRTEVRAMLRLATVLLGRTDLADDAVQEAFAGLGTHLDRLPPEEHGPYLRRAVVNACRSHHRRTGATKRQPIRSRDLVVSVEDLAVARTERDRLGAAIDGLATRQRECLVLRYYAELTDTEIATTLGISIGSAKTHLRRGLDALRSTIGDRDA